MKYYMVKVIRAQEPRVCLKTGINPNGRRFIRFATPWGGIGFVFSSGNGHYLQEPTKKEFERIKRQDEYYNEVFSDDVKYPKKKNEDPDMRYKINRDLLKNT